MFSGQIKIVRMPWLLLALPLPLDGVCPRPPASQPIRSLNLSHSISTHTFCASLMDDSRTHYYLLIQLKTNNILTWIMRTINPQSPSTIRDISIPSWPLANNAFVHLCKRNKFNYVCDQEFPESAAKSKNWGGVFVCICKRHRSNRQQHNTFAQSDRRNRILLTTQSVSQLDSCCVCRLVPP